MKVLKRILLIIVMIILLFCLTGCTGGFNQQIIDLNYKYTKCITWVGNKVIEIEIDKWNDYEGEQIQIVGKDGNVYLVSSMNSILINEK